MVIDIDECVQELDVCDDVIIKCVNMLGFYKCFCYQENYVWDGKSCVGN